MTNKLDADFVHFLDSMINLDALHRMTTDLDNELKDSQAVMNDIKGMIDALPARVVESEPDNSGLRHEDFSNFLAAGTPNLLLPDMEVNVDLDLDDVIATMKSYVEDIKNSFSQSEPEMPARVSPKPLESLELEQYASSLDHLCKRLSHLKLSKKAEESCSNTELETKLSLLCEDVSTFTKMVQAKTTLSEAHKNWPSAPQTTNTLGYDNLVNKLLTDINSVSCLLRSRN